MIFKAGQEYGSASEKGPMVRDALFMAEDHIFQSCDKDGKKEWWFSQCRLVECSKNWKLILIISCAVVPWEKERSNCCRCLRAIANIIIQLLMLFSFNCWCYPLSIANVILFQLLMLSSFNFLCCPLSQWAWEIWESLWRKTSMEKGKQHYQQSSCHCSSSTRRVWGRFVGKQHYQQSSCHSSYSTRIIRGRYVDICTN